MEGDEDVAVEEAVRRLLAATRDFTRAYEVWAGSPGERDDRRHVLEEAERRLTLARNDVISAQLRKH